jgi:pimeloyl-ACP methyl ester carboxylesterase
MPADHGPGRQDPPRTRRVRSGQVALAVREYDAPPGHAGTEHAVLVHGYPDSQGMWTPVAHRLAAAGIHVVTYDVRGAGASDVPARTDDYRVELLVDDLVAVVDAAVPAGERVHLVGHDWGSVQLWEAVLAEAADPRLRGRIASFTSVSGPALEHFSYLLRNPRGRKLRVLRQLAHSWYVLAFQVPLVPELAWRAVGGTRGQNGANGVNLYRANLHRGTAQQAPRRTDVPVLVVAPRRDLFLTGLVLEELDRICTRVCVVRPDTGHWLPRTDPDALVALVVDQIRGGHSTRPEPTGAGPSRAERRLRRRRSPRRSPGPTRRSRSWSHPG